MLCRGVRLLIIRAVVGLAVVGLAVVGAISFSSSRVLADGSVSAGFRSGGYDPSQITDDGKQSCQGSSAENFLFESLAQGDAVSAVLKRQMLVYAAVGFADTSKRRNNLQKNAGIFAPLDASECKLTAGNDCTGASNLIRELSKLGPNQDWCAAFVVALSKAVDEQAGGGSVSKPYSTFAKSSALDYASAAKLLAIFDPDVPLSSIAWGKNSPRKRTEDFLPPNMRPVPGCMAIYQSKSGEGHVGLVVGSTGSGASGSMNMVEGNSRPKPGSEDRGVFFHSGRTWGAGATIDSNDGRTIEKLEYKGCVLPWPGDSVIASAPVCPQAASDAKLKLSDPAFIPSNGIPTLAGTLH